MEEVLLWKPAHGASSVCTVYMCIICAYCVCICVYCVYVREVCVCVCVMCGQLNSHGEEQAHISVGHFLCKSHFTTSASGTATDRHSH